MSINLSINKNNYYSIRFRIHKNLVPYFKKKAVNKSLYTTDIKLAQSKASMLYHEYMKINQVIYLISTEQIQQQVDNFIKQHLEQNIMTKFNIEDKKYIAVTSMITVRESYSKFCKWYKLICQPYIIHRT